MEYGTKLISSRPLLSRSGCIWTLWKNTIILTTVLVPFYRGAVVFERKNMESSQIFGEVLVPFYRGAVVFEQYLIKEKMKWVLVPFYRGAVVFQGATGNRSQQSVFSSPFIEERLYFLVMISWISWNWKILVPFYRGAVVFKGLLNTMYGITSSRPLLSRSGCICYDRRNRNYRTNQFSSPFIEERLYLRNTWK